MKRWQPVADELRRRPGEWALIFEGHNGSASGLASNIVRGVPACWEPAGDFDATTRKGAESTLVYARYVGERTWDGHPPSRLCASRRNHGPHYWTGQTTGESLLCPGYSDRGA